MDSFHDKLVFSVVDLRAALNDWLKVESEQKIAELGKARDKAKQDVSPGLKAMT